MLDAGRKFNRSEFWTHVKPWEWQQRLDAGQKPPQIVLDPVEQPYITPLGQDFELYYDKVDQLIGVCGGYDDQDSLPGSKYFLPPPPLRCGEHTIKRAASS